MYATRKDDNVRMTSKGKRDVIEQELSETCQFKEILLPGLI